jgi:succinate-acetate transporter protein
MKRVLILFFLLLSFSLLGAAEVKSTAIADIGLTSGIFSGLKASLGKATISQNKSTEFRLNYKADLEVTF